MPLSFMGLRDVCRGEPLVALALTHPSFIGMGEGGWEGEEWT